MSLKLKWHLREIARTVLSIPFMTTAFLIVLIMIRFTQFRHLGLGMYEGFQIPKHYSLDFALDTFWDQSIAPLLPLFIPAVIFDAIIRRLVLKLNEA